MTYNTDPAGFDPTYLTAHPYPQMGSKSAFTGN